MTRDQLFADAKRAFEAQFPDRSDAMVRMLELLTSTVVIPIHHLKEGDILLVSVSAPHSPAVLDQFRRQMQELLPKVTVRCIQTEEPINFEVLRPEVADGTMRRIVDLPLPPEDTCICPFEDPLVLPGCPVHGPKCSRCGEPDYQPSGDSHVCQHYSRSLAPVCTCGHPRTRHNGSAVGHEGEYCNEEGCGCDRYEP